MLALQKHTKPNGIKSSPVADENVGKTNDKYDPLHKVCVLYTVYSSSVDCYKAGGTVCLEKG